MVERLHQARIGERGIIRRKRNKRSFTKRQKELERKKKAKEKMARRQGKRDQATEVEKP
jgi:hypothetical protein